MLFKILIVCSFLSLVKETKETFSIFFLETGLLLLSLVDESCHPPCPASLREVLVLLRGILGRGSGGKRTDEFSAFDHTSSRALCRTLLLWLPSLKRDASLCRHLCSYVGRAASFSCSFVLSSYCLSFIWKKPLRLIVISARKSSDPDFGFLIVFSFFLYLLFSAWGVVVATTTTISVQNQVRFLGTRLPSL